MTDATAPQAPDAGVPPYVAHFDLKFDPFSNEADESLFYPHPELLQLIDRLREAIGAGEHIPVVLGERGAGKSTTLRQLRRRAPGEWEVYAVRARIGTNADQLLWHIARRCLLMPEIDPAKQPASLHVHFLDRRANGKTPVVIVDDAHLLTGDALATLLSLAQPDKGEDAAVVVLFAEPGVMAALEHAQLPEALRRRLRNFELPRYSEDHVGTYINYRLSSAGFGGPLPLSPVYVRAITRASEGIPGRIHAHARNSLLEVMNWQEVNHTAEMPHRPVQRPRAFLAAAAAVVAAIALVPLLVRHVEWPWGADRARTEPVADAGTFTPAQWNPRPAEPRDPGGLMLLAEAVSETPAPRAAAPKTPPAEGGAADTPAPAVTAEAPPDAPKTGQPPTPPEPAKPGAAPAAAQTLAADANEMSTAPAAAPQDSPPAVPAAAPQPARDVAAQAKIRDAAWLLEQDPKAYTIQLLGVHDPSSIERYVRAHGLEYQVARYDSQLQGRPWHVLVYGLYPSRAQARAALKTLPAEVRKTGPWVRPLGEVQAAIRQHTKAPGATPPARTNPPGNKG